MYRQDHRAPRLSRSTARLLLPFLFGAISTPGWASHSAGSEFNLQFTGGRQPQEESKEEKIVFTWVASGRLAKKGSQGISFSNYRSNDSVVAQHRIERYASSEVALQERQRMLEQAEKVLERGPTRPSEGGGKGERFVLLTRRWKRGATQVAVVWTKGSDLYVMESPSLKHVLALERQLYP